MLPIAKVVLPAISSDCFYLKFNFLNQLYESVFLSVYKTAKYEYRYKCV